MKKKLNEKLLNFVKDNITCNNGYCTLLYNPIKNKGKEFIQLQSFRTAEEFNETVCEEAKNKFTSLCLEWSKHMAHLTVKNEYQIYLINVFRFESFEVIRYQSIRNY